MFGHDHPRLYTPYRWSIGGSQQVHKISGAGPTFRAALNQVDQILHDFNYGKSMIRSEIQTIIEFGMDGEKERAAQGLSGYQNAPQPSGAVTSDGIWGIGV